MFLWVNHSFDLKKLRSFDIYSPLAYFISLRMSCYLESQLFKGHFCMCTFLKCNHSWRQSKMYCQHPNFLIRDTWDIANFLLVNVVSSKNSGLQFQPWLSHQAGLWPWESSLTELGLISSPAEWRGLGSDDDSVALHAQMLWFRSYPK